jgi:hypothetical protein
MHYIRRLTVCCFSDRGGPEEKREYFCQANNGHDFLHIYSTVGAEFLTKRDQVQGYFIDAVIPDVYREKA